MISDIGTDVVVCLQKLHSCRQFGAKNGPMQCKHFGMISINVIRDDDDDSENKQAVHTLDRLQDAQGSLDLEKVASL